MQLIIRFLIGGVIVSAFAIIGSLFKPTSFAGLFGAAPSVALATLFLAITKDGKLYASSECRSMVAGAVALGLYSLLVCKLLIKFRISALKATVSSILLWFAAAFCFWQFFLRR